MRARARLGVVAACLLVVGCGAPVNLAESVQLVDVSSGWYDVGVTEQGLNKLVPSITFRIKNTGPDELSSVFLNVIFKLTHETEDWTTAFVRGIGPDGLAPGAVTDPVVVRAQQGYTSTQPRVQMLSNSQFVDFRVEIFGKHGSGTWTKLAQFPITRQLLTR